MTDAWATDLENNSSKAPKQAERDISPLRGHTATGPTGHGGHPPLLGPLRNITFLVYLT